MVASDARSESAQRFAPHTVVCQLGARPRPVFAIHYVGASSTKIVLATAERIEGALESAVQARRDLLLEARRIATLASPNVTRVREVAVRDHDLLIFSDFVDGEKLQHLWTPRGVPLEVALRLLVDALSGAAALHNLRDANQEPLKLAHGELSPATIAFGVDGVARVLHTVGRRAVGARPEPDSVPYMAPEVHLGQDYDARADVFGVGVMLWELLSGERLFGESDAAAVVARVHAGPLPEPAVPEKAAWAKGLVSVAAKALAAAPSDRWPNAGAMAAEIRKAAGLKLAPASAAAAFARSAFGDRVKARRERLERGPQAVPAPAARVATAEPSTDRAASPPVAVPAANEVAPPPRASKLGAAAHSRTPERPAADAPRTPRAPPAAPPAPVVAVARQAAIPAGATKGTAGRPLDVPLKRPPSTPAGEPRGATAKMTPPPLLAPHPAPEAAPAHQSTLRPEPKSPFVAPPAQVNLAESRSVLPSMDDPSPSSAADTLRPIAPAPPDPISEQTIVAAPPAAALLAAAELASESDIVVVADSAPPPSMPPPALGGFAVDPSIVSTAHPPEPGMGPSAPPPVLVESRPPAMTGEQQRSAGLATTERRRRPSRLSQSEIVQRISGADARTKTLVLGSVAALGVIIFGLAGLRLAFRGSQAGGSTPAVSIASANPAQQVPPVKTPPPATPSAAVAPQPAGADARPAPVRAPPKKVPPAAAPVPTSAPAPRATPVHSKPRTKPTFEPNSL